MLGNNQYKKITIEDVKELAKTKGGKCLSNIYINSKSKLEFECEKNHTWTTKFKNAKDTWCYLCNKERNDKINIKICKNCGNTFLKNKKCRICANFAAKKYRDLNKISINEKRKGNSKYIATAKLYQKNNKKNIDNKRRQSRKNKYENDMIFKLHHTISSIIRQGVHKNKTSITVYLLYTIQELKNHIEKQFKIIGNEWMNWNNWGKYDPKTWDDNDSNTWTWNIDHIIPQSDLPYISMKDENFKKCWALENLRPYSAKQNLLDGATRVRHL